MRRRPARKIGLWAALAITVLSLFALYSDIRRLENPVGEKYIFNFGPGQTDFNYPYVGSRALAEGVNPYHNDRADLTSPFFAVEKIDGVAFKQIYPPGHLILLLPLAKIYGADWASAAKVWFHILLLGIMALSVIAWVLARRVTEIAISPTWIIAFVLALTLNHGSQLGLDRGQSDTISALFCWLAVYCYLHRNVGIAVFLAVCGTGIKGYPLLFAAGLGLLSLRRASWKHAVVGGLLGVVLSVLPVAHYLPDAMKGISYRSEMFLASHFNIGFRNVAYYLDPSWAIAGRRYLSLFALVVTGLAWVQALRAVRHGSPWSKTLWLSVFAVAALGMPMGYSALSVAYNLILILPGVIIVMMGQERLSSSLSLSRWEKHLLGVTWLFVAFLFAAGLWGSRHIAEDYARPVSGFGLVAMFVVLLVLVTRALSRPLASLR